MKRILLVSDIGGTNSRFSIFSSLDNSLEMKDSKWLSTAQYPSFEALLREVREVFKTYFQSPIYSCVIAAAGPVNDRGECTPPNIPWTLSEQTVKNTLQIPNAKIVNDFIAQSYAISTHIVKDALILKKPQHSSASKGIEMIGIVGPGTGLGKALVSKQNGIYNAFASEGGHSSFPAINGEEMAYLEFIKQKKSSSYATEEHLLCGNGIELLYEYKYKSILSIKEISHQLKINELEDIAEEYSRYLARVCRNFTLNILATGGIYITGGVLAKTFEILRADIFKKEFEDSRTQKKLLEETPVFVLCNENSGLWGAAKIANQM